MYSLLIHQKSPNPVRGSPTSRGGWVRTSRKRGLLFKAENSAEALTVAIFLLCDLLCCKDYLISSRQWIAGLSSNFANSTCDQINLFGAARFSFLVRQKQCLNQRSHHWISELAWRINYFIFRWGIDWTNCLLVDAKSSPKRANRIGMRWQNIATGKLSRVYDCRPLQAT